MEKRLKDTFLNSDLIEIKQEMIPMGCGAMDGVRIYTIGWQNLIFNQV
jgi:hypothetical protein